MSACSAGNKIKPSYHAIVGLLISARSDSLRTTRPISVRLLENSLTSFFTAMSRAPDCASVNVIGHSKLHKQIRSFTVIRNKITTCSSAVKHFQEMQNQEITSSSAIAKRPSDASCLSVVSFNGTKCRVESFTISYVGYRFITACS